MRIRFAELIPALSVPIVILATRIKSLPQRVPRYQWDIDKNSLIYLQSIAAQTNSADFPRICTPRRLYQTAVEMKNEPSIIRHLSKEHLNPDKHNISDGTKGKT